MRNESLHAYSLHQRPYQEKRSIYYLFTKEHGVLHGLAKKGIPQFVPLTLFATGKKSLKTLQQVTIANTVPKLIGQQQYAALYVNELTLKLLPVEDSLPNIYHHYEKIITQLQQSLDLNTLKLALRHYEYVVLNELGFGVDLDIDSDQHPIQLNSWYRYATDSGWLKQANIEDLDNSKMNAEQNVDITSVDSILVDTKTDDRMFSNDSNNFSKRQTAKLPQGILISGQAIIAMRTGITDTTLEQWSHIHRQLIDYLFDYQPLQSRILWRQFQHYQS